MVRPKSTRTHANERELSAFALEKNMIHDVERGDHDREQKAQPSRSLWSGIRAEGAATSTKSFFHCKHQEQDRLKV